MKDIVILGTARTPIGAFRGELSSLSAPQLGARALAAAIERSEVPAGDLEQVYMGAVLTAGLGQAPARQVGLAAGCSPSTGAVTVGKVCGSSMRAVMTAANDLRCGDFELVAAGGMESMSQAPYLAAKARDGLRLGHGRLVDSMIQDGLWDPYNDLHMGSCAEICAEEYSFSRKQQDEFSLESYRRAREATENGGFAAEIVAVEVPRRKGGPKIVDRDEEPFRVDLDRIAHLKPAFKKDGTVTAGNASKINDGAAALILTTAENAERRNLAPRARILGHATFAQAPEWFTTSPAAAVRKVLGRCELDAGEIDLWEVNEAFSVVVMAFIEELGLSPEQVNVHGGAVALGHPIGASGARILITLLHALERRGLRRGCATICIGGGEATAILIDRESES
jgi:acetyl-CoA C-acetyltransferase